jgi:hypothetical protein
MRIFVRKVYCNTWGHRCSPNTFFYLIYITVDICNSIIMNNNRWLYNITRWELYCHVYGATRDENNGFWIGWLNLLALWFEVLLITLITALSLIYTLSCSTLHALRFSAFTCHLLATDLNTETSTFNHYEVFLPFLVQSSWNLGIKLKPLFRCKQTFVI